MLLYKKENCSCSFPPLKHVTYALLELFKIDFKLFKKINSLQGKLVNNCLYYVVQNLVNNEYVMSTIKKLLFGPNHVDDWQDGKNPFVHGGLLFLSFLLLVIVRLCLPFESSDTSVVYESIVDGLLNHQNWAKQSLVGVLEYPPLPAVVLLILEYFTSGLNRLGIEISSLSLMVAIAQSWIFLLIYKILRPTQCCKYLTLFYSAIVFLLLVFSASLFELSASLFGWEVMIVIFQQNPMWCIAVPVVSIFYHGFSFDRTGNNKDLIFIAFYSGVLVFCGLSGIILAIAVVMYLFSQKPVFYKTTKTSRLLLMIPFLYALLLYPVFNLLIMGEAFFVWDRLQGYLPTFKLSYYPICLAIALLLICIFSMFDFIKHYLRITAFIFLGLVFIGISQKNSDQFIAGLYLLAGLIIIPILIHFIIVKREEFRQLILLGPVLLIVLVASQSLRVEARNGEYFLKEHKASAELLGNYIDGRWKDSRIMIYGLRMAVLYHKDDRFVANLDYDEGFLRQEAKNEQLHILIPPDNNIYHSKSSQLAGLDESIPSWLFLEDINSVEGASNETVPAGWRLWRCVRTND